MQAAQHATDEELLLLADGELSARNRRRVEAHLAGCPQCRAQQEKLEATLAHFREAHSHAHPSIIEPSGPHALLKARLAELVQQPANRGSKHLPIARSLAYACAAALLFAIGLGAVRYESTRSQPTYAAMLPDPSFTPGSTRNVSLSDLCSQPREEVVRSVPDPLQQKVFAEYGIQGQPAANFEVDYLITPGLGGADDVRNLWPEPHANATWNSYVKDQLEDHLHTMVCGGRLSLGEAQRDIASNWIAAYKKYFHTDQPLAAPELAGEQAGLAQRQRVGLRRKQRLS